MSYRSLAYLQNSWKTLNTGLSDVGVIPHVFRIVNNLPSIFDANHRVDFAHRWE
jgi:hypothetical protein